MVTSQCLGAPSLGPTGGPGWGRVGPKVGYSLSCKIGGPIGTENVFLRSKGYTIQTKNNNYCCYWQTGGRIRWVYDRVSWSLMLKQQIRYEWSRKKPWEYGETKECKTESRQAILQPPQTEQLQRVLPAVSSGYSADAGWLTP